jgi:hypothetical protein
MLASMTTKKELDQYIRDHGRDTKWTCLRLLQENISPCRKSCGSHVWA